MSVDSRNQLQHSLSDEQQAAVNSDAHAIVVVASAGSGKTEVVARRVERLLTESPDEDFRVLALSYTLKAAEELGRRFSVRLGELRRRVDTHTVHAFAHSLLRNHGTRIGLPVEPEVLTRDEDRAELLARWLEDEGRAIPPDLPALFFHLDVARATLKPSALLDEWEAALDSVGALDYGSMLVRARELLELPSARRQIGRLYGHVIVDEAQNLTAAQYGLLRAVIGPPTQNRHIPAVLVGDDKQSIVSFAGADPELMRTFATEYKALRFELRKNFRSAASIVAVGRAVAQELGHSNGNATPETYAAEGKLQFHELPDEETEGDFVSSWVTDLLANGLPSEALAQGETPHIRAEDVAVLSRSAAGLSQTHTALERAGLTPAIASTPEDWLATIAGKVVFELIGLRSAGDHRSVHWQLARLLGASESDATSLERLHGRLQSHDDPTIRTLAPLCQIDSPQSFIDALQSVALPGGVGDEQLASWEADSTQLREAWRTFEQETNAVERTWGNFRLYVGRLQRGDDLHPGVRLVTVHKAQGREYRAAAIVGLNEGQFPDFRASTEEDRIAELRTFYVAVSRPARLLLLTRARSRQTRYGPRQTHPSSFLRFLSR